MILVRIDMANWYNFVNFLPVDGDFLCRLGQEIWVSRISVNEVGDSTMPANCPQGCMYVQPKTNKAVIPVNQLDELYYIQTLHR